TVLALSFPTRRSSDLTLLAFRHSCVIMAQYPSSAVLSDGWSSSWTAAPVLPAPATSAQRFRPMDSASSTALTHPMAMPVPVRMRSEQHTSELQSREKL